MNEQYQFSEEIIRAYDIRGIYGENLTEKDAYFLALKLLEARSKLGLNGSICIARDGRLSSPALYLSLLNGFLTNKVEVIDLGVVPTPMLYFAAYFLNNIDIAVMITGSHNPSNHNGFKIILNGVTLFGEQLLDLAALNICNDSQEDYNESCFVKIYEANQMLCEKVHSVTSEYIKITTNLLSFSSNLRVVWDPGNGAACSILPQILRSLPGSHKIINHLIDGNFPSHHPDPSKHENLLQLIEEVKLKNYDFGIAFDGDADRLGVVDRDGNILSGGHLVYIFAKDLVQRHSNPQVIIDMKMSSLIINALRKINCHPIQYKTGHALIKAKMRETNALLAAEMSGHIFFGENYYGFDDAIFGACKLLEIVSKNPQFIEEALKITRNAVLIEDYITADNNQKKAYMDLFKKFLLKRGYAFNEMDGMRIDSEFGWMLIRASNTENIITLNGESYTEEMNTTIQSIFANLTQIAKEIS